MDMGPIREEREALRREVEMLRAELARYKEVAHKVLCPDGTQVVASRARSGVWGAHGSDDVWSVDHLPSGKRVWIGDADFADQLVSQLGERLPDWQLGSDPSLVRSVIVEVCGG